MNTLHPGLYVLDAQPKERPVSQVGSSTAAFVGVTEKGLIGGADYVASWADFVRKYGDFVNSGYLAYAVRSFFMNGGGAAWISRVVHFAAGVKTSALATKTFKSSTNDVLKVDALSDGTWGNLVGIQITKNASDFTLAIFDNGTKVEEFIKLTMDTVETAVNGVSQYVTVEALQTTLPDTVSVTTVLAGGDDGLTSLADTDYIGDSAKRTGLYAFDSVDVQIVAVPGITSVAVHNALTGYCANRGDCFGVLDSPVALDPT
jgi:phage tail sheath protein FI